MHTMIVEKYFTILFAVANDLAGHLLNAHTCLHGHRSILVDNIDGVALKIIGEHGLEQCGGRGAQSLLDGGDGGGGGGGGGWRWGRRRRKGKREAIGGEAAVERV